MSRLTCTQCEGMLLDAADDCLLPDEQTHFDLHIAECPNCTRLLADLRRGGAWMEMLKEAPPAPPADLVDRILARTSGDPEVSAVVMAQAAHAASLFGDSQARILPFRVPAHLQQPRTRMARMMHTVMQPRFAMT
ncbi:MAG: anti-sigma factor family protein, partial [Janthinobacterium lividum]